jgi:GTP-binding protein
MIKIVFVGRANVGKSTLFNCFSPKYKAITMDTPGVTRDVKSAEITWHGLQLHIVDTPGYHNDALIGKDLATHMDTQIQYEAADADRIFFVVDGVDGLTPRDRDIAQLLRRTNRPVTVIVNKCDRKDARIEPFYELGFDSIIPLSAAHQEGFAEVVLLLNGLQQEEQDEKINSDQLPTITIMGRPNVGKSSLTNIYLKEDRQLVGAMPGLTRDSVSYPVDYKGYQFTLMDTAGLRKKNKMLDPLESLSADSSREALRFTNGVIFMMDATALNPYDLDSQDLALISEIIEEGRCVCVAVNKCDLVDNQKDIFDEAAFQIRKKFFDIPVIPISVKTGQNLDKLLKTMLQCIDHFNARISTGKLNAWLRDVVDNHTMPTEGGRALKAKYITQVGTRPPKFSIFVNRKIRHMHNFERFLMHRLREEFSYQGVPIRLSWRVQKRSRVMEAK